MLPTPPEEVTVNPGNVPVVVVRVRAVGVALVTTKVTEAVASVVPALEQVMIKITLIYRI